MEKDTLRKRFAKYISKNWIQNNHDLKEISCAYAILGFDFFEREFDIFYFGSTTRLFSRYKSHKIPLKIQALGLINQLYFFCPACQDTHAVNQSWSFNEDYEKPSLEPSIRVTGYKDGKPFECHTWMTKGRLKYFADCSHHMAGQQWIDIPEYPNDQKYN